MTIHFYYIVFYVYALSMFELTTISFSGFIIIYNYGLKAEIKYAGVFFQAEFFKLFSIE